MIRHAALSEQPSVERRIRQVVRTGRAMDAALWGVCLLVAYFSAGNVFAFAIDHDTPWYVALVLAPIVDVALFSVIAGDSILGRLGVVLDSRWPKGLRLFAAGATWVLNVWQSTGWFEDRPMDVAGVVLHSIPPVVLIFLAESTPAYRVAFSTALDQLRSAVAGGPDRTETVKATPVATPPIGLTTEQLIDSDVPDQAEVSPVHRTTPQLDRAAASVGELLPVAQEVAEELAATGRTLSRRALADGVRARGFTCSTDRATVLLAALDAAQRARRHVPTVLNGATSGGAL